MFKIKILSALLCLMVLIISADSRAADNLTLNKHTDSSQLSPTFFNLGGGAAMSDKTYHDDDQKTRTDKVYYTSTHSYNSNYSSKEIAMILNPSTGRLGNLFEDTKVEKSSKSNGFNVMMGISTPLKTFDCASTLTFKSFKSSGKDIYVYTFSNFNMVFTGIVIQVEVEEVGPETKIKLFQIAAVKGSTYDKLKSYLAVGKFEKALKVNIRKLKDGVGGI
ncbi:MAG: hypothetical protein H0V66_07615 [Bdellovibrionales bacterium]|nr:hypothetical protein [Bdellovibrionales bacterium]